MIKPTKNSAPRRHKKGWPLWKVAVTELVKAGGRILIYYTWAPIPAQAKQNIKARFNFDYKRDRNAWVDMNEPVEER